MSATVAIGATTADGREAIRQPAEVRCVVELAALAARDWFPRPTGSQLSPRLGDTFILARFQGCRGLGRAYGEERR